MRHFDRGDGVGGGHRCGAESITKDDALVAAVRTIRTDVSRNAGMENAVSFGDIRVIADFTGEDRLSKSENDCGQKHQSDKPHDFLLSTFPDVGRSGILLPGFQGLTELARAARGGL